MRMSFSTMSGYRIAKWTAICPPMEWPASTIRDTPSDSQNERRDPMKQGMSYAASGLSESPQPGRSTAIECKRGGSARCSISQSAAEPLQP